MKVQTLYIFAGLVCGLVLGPHIGLAAARTMGDVSWLYEFQNGAWVSWVVIPFGAIIGLMVLFFCYQFGAAAGRRYDGATGRRLKHVKAVPWALIIVGIAVGATTVGTVGDGQLALVGYVQEKKNATARLLALEGNLHRITGLDLDLADSSVSGRIDLIFRGRREGDYRIEWRVHSKIAKDPILGGSQFIRLGREPGNADIPISRWDIAAGYLKWTENPEADLSVNEKFTLVVQLRPILSPEESAAIPEDEARRLTQDDSILLSRVGKEFRLRFAIRDGHIAW